MSEYLATLVFVLLIWFAFGYFWISRLKRNIDKRNEELRRTILGRGKHD